MGQLEEIMKVGADGWGIPLSTGALASFRAYHDFLYERNAVQDLTNVPPEEGAARSHFLDSLSLYPYVKDTDRVMDIGSGAGFPGLPLKILRPEIRLTLLDSNVKRTDFLSALWPKCGCGEVEVLHGRAEEIALLPEYRDGYELAVSRAVAKLGMLAELCLPFVKVGGALLAMKAAGCGEEVDSAKNAIAVLGGRLEAQLPYTVPGTDIPRVIVVIRKIKPTPKGYPRRFAKIKAKPL